MREPRSLLVVGLCVVAAACGDDPPPTQPVPPTEVEETEGDPASATGDPCARDLADQTPEPVRATLRDLGYEAVFDDACLARRAEDQRDVGACATLSVSTLRERCVVRVAVATARPLDCPASRTIEGRDPLCVALAARDRRLCAAAGLVDEAVCARALGSEHACRELPEEERALCRARSTDLASRVDGSVRTSPALHPTFTLIGEGGTQRAIGSAARGARIVWHECTRTLVVGEPPRTTPFGAPAVSMSVAVPGPAPFDATFSTSIEEAASTLSVALDGHAAESAAGTITIRTLDDALGGLVEGSFHASTGAGEAPIEGSFTTFVRDRDEAPAGCAPP